MSLESQSSSAGAELADCTSIEAQKTASADKACRGPLVISGQRQGMLSYADLRHLGACKLGVPLSIPASSTRAFSSRGVLIASRQAG